MKPYNERLPMIDEAIESTGGDIKRIKDYRKTDTHINYMGKLGFFSVDAQWAFCGDTVCTHEEFEQRKAELVAKEQEMNNDWYEKGELPPVGEVVEIYDCHSQLQSWNGKQVEVLRNIKSPDGERLSVVLLDGWVDATLISTKKLRPLRAETDKLVEQMCDDAIIGRIKDAELNPIIVAAIERLAEKGYRKIKPISEDEFVEAYWEILGAYNAREMYQLGFRQLDQGETK